MNNESVDKTGFNRSTIGFKNNFNEDEDKHSNPNLMKIPSELFEFILTLFNDLTVDTCAAVSSEWNYFVKKFIEVNKHKSVVALEFFKRVQGNMISDVSRHINSFKQEDICTMVKLSLMQNLARNAIAKDLLKIDNEDFMSLKINDNSNHLHFISSIAEYTDTFYLMESFKANEFIYYNSESDESNEDWGNYDEEVIIESHFEFIINSLVDKNMFAQAIKFVQSIDRVHLSRQYFDPMRRLANKFLCVNELTYSWEVAITQLSDSDKFDMLSATIIKWIKNGFYGVAKEKTGDFFRMSINKISADSLDRYLSTIGKKFIFHEEIDAARELFNLGKTAEILHLKTLLLAYDHDYTDAYDTLKTLRLMQNTTLVHNRSCEELCIELFEISLRNNNYVMAEMFVRDMEVKYPSLLKIVDKMLSEKKCEEIFKLAFRFKDFQKGIGDHFMDNNELEIAFQFVLAMHAELPHKEIKADFLNNDYDLVGSSLLQEVLEKWIEDGLHEKANQALSIILEKGVSVNSLKKIAQKFAAHGRYDFVFEMLKKIAKFGNNEIDLKDIKFACTSELQVWANWPDDSKWSILDFLVKKAIMNNDLNLLLELADKSPDRETLYLFLANKYIEMKDYIQASRMKNRLLDNFNRSKVLTALLNCLPEMCNRLRWTVFQDDLDELDKFLANTGNSKPRNGPLHIWQ